MTSLTLFVIGSCLCGVAWSANSLIAFRVVQGIGGGMLLPVGQSILARAAGPQRMGRVMSIIGVPLVLGPIMGPVIGGLIVSNFSWRWIFYINLPIGIVTLALSSRWLPKWDTDERFVSSFDTLGFCLLSPGLAALVYSLAEVGTTGSFTSMSVVISFVLGIVLMAGFILHALHIKNPLLELHLFKDRSFTIANICIFMLGFTLFGSMFLLPLYYQIARGQEAWVAGLLMAPQGIGAACIMRWAGSMTDRVGPRRIVPFGILLMAAATVPFAFVTSSTSEVLLAGTLFVRGIGLGLTMMPVTAAAYVGLTHAEIPKASTTMNIVRQVGGSVATALFAVVLERQIVTQLGPAAVKAGGSTGVISATGALPPQVADPVAAAFAHTFWWAIGAILIAFIPTRSCPIALRSLRTVAPLRGRRRRRRACDRDARHRGHDRLTSQPDRLLADVTAQLSAAVASRQKRKRSSWPTVPAATRQVLQALVDRRLTGEPLAWITGRSLFGERSVIVHPGVYVPRWQSLELARRAAARLPSLVWPSTSARARAQWPTSCRRPGRAPGSWRRTVTGGRWPAPGPTGSRPGRETCSGPCRRCSGPRPTSSSRSSPTSPPPNCTCSPGTRSRSRTPPTTTAGPMALRCCGGSSPRRPASCAPEGHSSSNWAATNPTCSALSWSRPGTARSRPGATRTGTYAAWRRPSAERAQRRAKTRATEVRSTTRQRGSRAR